MRSSDFSPKSGSPASLLAGVESKAILYTFANKHGNSDFALT